LNCRTAAGYSSRLLTASTLQQDVMLHSLTRPRLHHLYGVAAWLWCIGPLPPQLCQFLQLLLAQHLLKTTTACDAMFICISNPPSCQVFTPVTAAQDHHPNSSNTVEQHPCYFLAPVKM